MHPGANLAPAASTHAALNDDCVVRAWAATASDAPDAPTSIEPLKSGRVWNSRSDLGTDLVGWYLMGGMGSMPASPSSRAVVSLGCAPSDSQYLMRSVFSLISLAPSRVCRGL